VEAFGLLIVIGILIWAFSPSKSQPKNRGYSPQSSKFSSISTPTNKTTTFQTSGNVIKDGFQPSDRCTCGGSWIKRGNSETGGRFFSCSNYPRCKNSREKVLKERLGSKYNEIYCSHGHHKPTSGTVEDPRTGRTLCQRCVDRGYVKLRPAQPEKTYSTPAPKTTYNYSNLAKIPTRKSGTGELCRNGHPRTPENTYIRPDGSRECRVCKRNAR
jgi:hypothetical protein